MVSVTLFAAFTRLPHTAPLTNPAPDAAFSSLIGLSIGDWLLLLNRDHERWCANPGFVDLCIPLSGVVGAEEMPMGVAGVMDMAGIFCCV
jgi:hypothetical protein